MNDKTIEGEFKEVWPDKTLTEGQRQQRGAAELIPFGEHGTSPENFAQLVDFAKHMASAKGMLGTHFIGNYGGCLAIIELAEQFRMKPFMLARQTYFVNGMIAFDGQAIMSIMNLHLELEPTPDGKKGQLQYEFFGEKAVYEPIEVNETDRDDRPTGKKIWITKLVKPSTRWVRVTGTRKNEATPRVYESPPVFQIKNKKSPLWEEDEDQQLTYWASRRWQRKHWPEGLLGIIDREEAMSMHIGADNAKLVSDASNKAQGLIERLAERNGTHQDTEGAPIREGFTNGHTEKETSNGHEVAKDPKPEAAQPPAEPKEAESDKGRKSRKKASAKAEAGGDVKSDPKADDAKDHDAETGEVLPKNPAEWKVYATAKISEMKADPKITKRDMQSWWEGDRSLRNNCGVTSEYRAQSGVEPLYAEVFHDKAD